MVLLPRATWIRWFMWCICVLVVTIIVLAACDDGEAPKKRRADGEAKAQLQAQLDSERALRLSAEQSARAAEESRSAWVIGLGAGACVACVLVGLLGVHIGARAISRARQEPPHG